MINRDAIACLTITTALTLAGTYYVVDWVSPPITQSMPHSR
jgi:hypothetical protein